MFTCACGFYRSNFKSNYQPGNICPVCRTGLANRTQSFIPNHTSTYNSTGKPKISISIPYEYDINKSKSIR
jgi:hypothetical protein